MQMEDDKPLTEHESLELIASMINKVKYEFEETGVSCLLWGGVITFCSLVSLVGFLIKNPQLYLVWNLTVVAVIAQVVIVMRERRKRKFRSHDSASMSGIWISFGISMFMFSFYVSLYAVKHENALFLIIYGIPTFATGISRSFKPMILGGLACWALAIGAMYTPDGYTFIYSAVAAQLAWFIPGLILRKKYLEAKRGNV